MSSSKKSSKTSHLLKNRNYSRATSFFFVSLFLCSVANGQNFSITGAITDSSGTALASASVIVITQTDSSLVGFSTSGGDGRFTVARLEPGSYILQVSFVGFETLMRDFDVEDQDVDVGVINLSTKTKVLEEFVVRAERLPFVVRGDTIEYHALAFLLRPQDMVEDLLRRLPGVDVDRSGTITAQGEVVENVLVEGKDFFGGDPQITTKNLPADAVEHVQVFDKASDMEELTGVPDGLEEKTINLELTEDAKRGFLGQTTGGFGGEEADLGRYFGRGTLFRFSPRTQFALIGSGENINQPGFSSQQLRGFLRAGNLRRTEINGYTESLGFGINLNRELSTHTTINVSYLLADEKNQKKDAVIRHQLLGDTQTAMSNESNSQGIKDISHEIGLNAEMNLGKGHDILLRGSFAKSISATKYTGIERLRTYSGTMMNSANTLSDDSSDHLRGAMELTWRKRISKSGRSLVVETKASKQDGNGTNDLYTDVLLHTPEEMVTQEERHQLQEHEGNSFLHSQRIQLVQPLRSGQTLTVYVKNSSRKRNNEKRFFDLADEQKMLIEKFGDGLSENQNYLSSGMSYTWRAEDHSWLISGDLEAQHSRRKGATILKPDQTIRRTYTHILSHLLGKRNLGEHGTLNFFYQTSTRGKYL